MEFTLTMPQPKQEQSGQASVLTAPLIYAVQLTTVCNNFCSGCGNSLLAREKRRRKERIEYLEDWRTLFNRICPLDDRHRYAKGIRITGGEPTLHREFEQIIAYIDQLEISHVLLTTGRWTLNRPDTIMRVYRQCQNFQGMLISLHGLTAEMHNGFVENTTESYYETCRSIQMAGEAGLPVYTNVVLTKYNIGHVEAMIDFSLGLGARFVVFNRYLGLPHAAEPTVNELRQAIGLIEALKQRGYPCRIGNHIPPCFTGSTTLRPSGGESLCNISPTGLVRPDNYMQHGFGNIFEQEIETIWQSPIAKAYRAFVPGGCKSCVALPACGGGAKSVLFEHGFAHDRLKEAPLLNYRSVTYDRTWQQILLSDD